MRNAGRLKLGYYPLPIEEARNLRNLLIATQPFFAVDPCAGDGTALAEITLELPAQNAAIELDADRAAAAAARGMATTHGSTFESHLPAGSCSLLYLNPPYDVEMGRHSNQRLELVFLDHCYGWLKTAGILIFVPGNCSLSLRQASRQPVRAHLRVSAGPPRVGTLPSVGPHRHSQTRTQTGRHAERRSATAACVSICTTTNSRPRHG